MLLEGEKSETFTLEQGIAGLLIADDFVGISDSSENLQKLNDVVHKFCNRWCW